MNKTVFEPNLKKDIDKHNSQILKMEKRNTNPNQTPIVISCGPER
jgi:hypothetical protein